MYVCVCNSVTDGDIREAVEAGVCSMEGLRSELKVSSCCGRCRDCANEVLNQALTNSMARQFPLAVENALA